MASLSSFNHVDLAKIAAIGHVDIAKVAAVNRIDVITSVPDSISLDIDYLDFYVDGVYATTNIIYVTASGSWYTSYLDDGDGIFFSCNPTSGATSQNVTISCEYWDSPFLTRSGRIQFVRDTAYVDLTIIQYDYF